MAESGRRAQSGSGSIFISFKSEERAIAAQLKNVLEDRHFDVWWAEDIQCGQRWSEELDRAALSARIIFVMWSPRAMASQGVRHEASQAIARAIYTPIRIELSPI